ncbi:glycosyl transferase [Bacillaceae bacterium SAOS 7]|nr:glycosyl transferase [Bacillaceae bacterium SAOS 7]
MKPHDRSNGQPYNQKVGYFTAKRAFDFSIACMLLVGITPILLLIGLLIMLFDGRPVFFKQIRTGYLGDSFIIWKFRTMRVHNDKLDHQYSWSKGIPTDFMFKTSNDNHVTKLGAVLRKYSLDELPQLINVIKGEMSIVGPRPEIPTITQLYNSEQKIRLHVKPGITGYAQVHGRSNINHGEKILYDLYYVQNCSFLLDLKIIIKTFIQVITGKGAY